MVGWLGFRGLGVGWGLGVRGFGSGFIFFFMFCLGGTARPLVSLRETRKIGAAQKLILGRRGMTLSASEMLAILKFLRGEDV